MVKIKAGSFESLNLLKPVYKAIKGRGFNLPTPIQRKSIPHILEGRDVVACSKTGSGKTGAFVIPLIHKLEKHSNIVGTRALIIAPSRELALQISSVVKAFTKYTDILHAVIVGGHGFEGQFESIASNPDIIIATPGRLMQLLDETEFSLKKVEYLVFDEADYLFELGFSDQLSKILSKVSQNRQTLLFSATLSNQISSFAKSGLKDYVYVKLSSEYTLADTLKLNFFVCREKEKLTHLIYILKELVKNNEQSIVFASSKFSVDFLETILRNFGVKAIGMYGKMDQITRKEHIMAVYFLSKNSSKTHHVIHYDFPTIPKIFIHRSGRTGRNQALGTVYALFNFNETMYITEIALHSGKTLSNKTEDLKDYQKISYGIVVDDKISYYHEVVMKVLLDIEIAKLFEISSKAQKKFLKTRMSASIASVNEAKNYNFRKTHPLFTPDSNALNLEMIKAYKPPISYLHWKKNKDPTSEEAKSFSKIISRFRRNEKPDIIKKYDKEEKIEEVEEETEFDNETMKILAKKLKANPKAITKDFKDPKYFIPTQPNPKGCSLFGVEGKINKEEITSFYVNDPDETPHNNQYKWDKNKKNFVRNQPEMKNVIGKNQLKGDKKDLAKNKYNKWKKTNSIKFQKDGEVESKKTTNVAKRLFSDRTRIMGYKNSNNKPVRVKNELKPFEQVLKSKKTDFKRKQKNAQKVPRNKISKRNNRK